jgi:hypothetical protein
LIVDDQPAGGKWFLQFAAGECPGKTGIVRKQGGVALGLSIGRMFVAGFYERGWRDPDDRDKADEAKGHTRVLEGEWDCHKIDEEG